MNNIVSLIEHNGNCQHIDCEGVHNHILKIVDILTKQYSSVTDIYVELWDTKETAVFKRYKFLIIMEGGKLILVKGRKPFDKWLKEHPHYKVQALIVTVDSKNVRIPMG